MADEERLTASEWLARTVGPKPATAPTEAATGGRIPQFQPAPDNPVIAAAIAAAHAVMQQQQGTAGPTGTGPMTANLRDSGPSPIPAPIAPSAPSAAVPLEREVDILTESSDAVWSRMQRAGANPGAMGALDRYNPRHRAARAEIRREWEASLGRKRVVLGPKK